MQDALLMAVDLHAGRDAAAAFRQVTMVDGRLS